MNIESQFTAEEINIKKAKPHGILMPQGEIGEIYCCIPIVEGMELSIMNHKGKISGEYEILYREVMPRQGIGVIRLPKIYLSCDVLLLK